MTPDRNEVITCLDDGETVELEPGVTMETLVGDFNTAQDLTTGIVTMQPDSLLPYHTHPCGESICIIHGGADCLVEGRQYSLSNCATTMVPRGRVHYFINLSEDPMDMIWVYSGPIPDRVVIISGFQRE